jgi:hypothetical protein
VTAATLHNERHLLDPLNACFHERALLPHRAPSAALRSVTPGVAFMLAADRPNAALRPLTVYATCIVQRNMRCWNCPWSRRPPPSAQRTHSSILLLWWNPGRGRFDRAFFMPILLQTHKVIVKGILIGVAMLVPTRRTPYST